VGFKLFGKGWEKLFVGEPLVGGVLSWFEEFVESTILRALNKVRGGGGI